MKGERLILAICILLCASFKAYSQQVDGSALFTTNCAACHTIGGGKLVGPDLSGVTERHNEAWLSRFIRESQVMVAEGDEKAVAVFNANSMIPMPSMPLSDKQIDALLDHIARLSKGQLDQKLKSAAAEQEVVASPKTQKRPSSKISENQRDVTKRALMTGLWVALAAASAMVVGIWYALKK